VVRPRVIPCLLLRGRGLVKTVRFSDPRYVGDPVNVVRIFNDKQVDELILLDITATSAGCGPHLDVIRDVASECFMPLACGGGVRSLTDARSLYALGIEKVVLNTHAVERPDLVSEIAAVYGSQSVVVAIDVRRNWRGRYEVVTRSAARAAGIDPVTHARAMATAGAGELLVNDVDRDGIQQGYDLELIRRVADAVPIPVIACGGAGSLEHLAQVLREGHAAAAAAGSLFVFHGRHRAVLVTYPAPHDIESLAGAHAVRWSAAAARWTPAILRSSSTRTAYAATAGAGTTSAGAFCAVVRRENGTSRRRWRR
jgi:cyclase